MKRYFIYRTPNGGIDKSRSTPYGAGSIAQANRHTGKPHEHKREIARNLRRANSNQGL